MATSTRDLTARAVVSNADGATGLVSDSPSAPMR